MKYYLMILLAVFGARLSAQSDSAPPRTRLTHPLHYQRSGAGLRLDSSKTAGIERGIGKTVDTSGIEWITETDTTIIIRVQNLGSSCGRSCNWLYTVDTAGILTLHPMDFSICQGYYYMDYVLYFRKIPEDGAPKITGVLVQGYDSVPVPLQK